MATKGNRVKFTRYYEPRENYALVPYENGEGIHDGVLFKTQELHNHTPNAPQQVAIVLLDNGGMLMVNPDDLEII